MCDLEVIGAPSRLRLIRKAAALARIDETRDLSIEEKAARRKFMMLPYLIAGLFEIEFIMNQSESQR